jgi:hypothetical protein
MSLRYLALLAAVFATATLALGASTASSGSSTQPQLANSTQQVGTLNVRLTIARFVKRGNKLYAVGTAIGKFMPAAGAPEGATTATDRQAFVVRVKSLRRLSSAQRICPVLDLTLGPLDLNLLGLMVHLDKTRLTITADSEGGLLGSLLCSLAGGGGVTAHPAKSAAKLTKAVHRSGLATKGVNLGVPLYQTTSGSTSGLSTTSGAVSPMAICKVLDLTLGPLDLNLLGLMVHLDTVHLVITADSEGGILGSLLCSLAGGGGGPPTT